MRSMINILNILKADGLATNEEKQEFQFIPLSYDIGRQCNKQILELHNYVFLI